MESYYIITISRQFGSLGRPIAKKLSEILHIDYYDRDIMEMACKELNKPVSELSAYDEKSYRRMKYPLGMGSEREQDALFDIQQCVISEISMRRKSCIFVGRCSDYILKHNKNVISFYIYAPYEQRVKNCIKDLDMEEIEAKKMIDSVDRARNNYHKYYTKLDEDTIENRQFLIDSSVFGVDGTAVLIADIVTKKYSNM